MTRLIIGLRKTIYFLFYSFDQLLGLKTHISVLCYHGISDDNWRYNTSKETFYAQISMLEKSGYKFISGSDLLDFLDNGKPVPFPSILLTFDDGYNDILVIRDFLCAKKIRPILFMITDSVHINKVGLGLPQDVKKLFLSANEISDLVRDGWEIGSHTSTHALLPYLDYSNKEAEISTSKLDLEYLLNQVVKYISYPRGLYDQSVIDIVRKAQYKLGFTMDDGFINKGSSRFVLPRVGIDHTHGVSEVLWCISPTVVWFRKLVKKTFLKLFSERYLK